MMPKRHITAEELTSMRSTLDSAMQFKEAGNAALRAGDVDKAIKEYHNANLHARSAKVYLSSEKWPEAEAEALRKTSLTVYVDVLNNLAVALMKKEKWQRVVSVTSDVLTVDANNCKALMRRAKAYIALNRYLLAEKDVDAGLKIDPTNKDLLHYKAGFAQRARESELKQKDNMRGWIDRM